MFVEMPSKGKMFFKNTYEGFTLNIANYTDIFVESRKYTYLHTRIS